MDRRLEWASEIAWHSRNLRYASEGSEEALTEIYFILRLVGKLGGVTLNKFFPVDWAIEDIEGRRNWLTAVSFLSITGLIGGLNELELAMFELNRGRQLASMAPLLTGKGSGKRTSYGEIFLRKKAIEFAARVASFCVKDAELVAKLKECGLSRRTLERFKEDFVAAPPPFQIREGAADCLSQAQAEAALKETMTSIKQCRERRLHAK